MRVLVTGSTGFIGSHLVEKLDKKGLSINVLVRKKNLNTPWLNRSKIFYGDVTDPESISEAIKGVDVVFNLAAMLGRWQSEFSFDEYCKVNLKGTKNLILAAQKENVKHFIHLSTAGVMGRLTRIPANEEDTLAPIFPYEKSKYLAELILNKFISQSGFPATIVRATHVYGPRDKNTVKIFNLMKKTRMFPLICGGINLFQPIYVEDLINALILCMDKRALSAGKTYLVAGKEIITYSYFISLCAKILNIPVLRVPLSKNLANFSAIFFEKTFTSFNLESPLTFSRVEFFSRDQTYNIRKIEREIGFFPQTSLCSGLRKMLAI